MRQDWNEGKELGQEDVCALSNGTTEGEAACDLYQP